MPEPILTFPFAAVAGQIDFKLALILAAINPAIGGVLVCGPRGSAKSTLARGLADIMPLHQQQHSFVTLPLGTTEEMLTGTLNLQQILNEQKVVFQDGLLAKANGGVLYVDEVNLLPDNLVDLLLDVSASGNNIVERDGISHQHKAEFILLGTMNPDEGELRPQLQDRFGFLVELSNEYSIDERIDIVQLREAFDVDPRGFTEQYRHQQQQLSKRIEQARTSLQAINCDLSLRKFIAERCHQAQVEGLRADIVWYRAAVAHAAWEQQNMVREYDVLAVEELVLAHRRKTSNSSTPPSPPPSTSFKRPPSSEHSLSRSSAEPSQASLSEDKPSPDTQPEGDWGSMEPQQQKTIRVPKVPVNTRNVRAKASHKTPHIVPNQLLGPQQGRGKVGALKSTAIDWFSTLLESVKRSPLAKGDVSASQLQFRKAKTGKNVLHLVLLDTSASTLQQGLLAKAKGVVFQISERAYLHREQLTILGFGNQKVDALLTKRRSPKQLDEWLDRIPAAGGTPLREVITQALQLQQQQLRQTPDTEIFTYLITDGRTSQSVDDIHLLGQVMVIDTEQSSVKRGKGRAIASALSANYFPLPIS